MGLTVLEGGANSAPTEAVGDALPNASPTRTLLRRASDRCEPWSVGDPGPFLELAGEAELRRLDVRTAIALVIERRLVVGELAPLGLSGAVAVLDEVAARARPSKPLWSASSAYLNGLLHGVDGDFETGAPDRAVALPARLSDRLGVIWPPRRQLRAAELEPAIAWEIAAVLEGLSMTEWALRETLSASRSRS